MLKEKNLVLLHKSSFKDISEENFFDSLMLSENNEMEIYSALAVFKYSNDNNQGLLSQKYHLDQQHLRFLVPKLGCLNFNNSDH